MNLKDRLKTSQKTISSVKIKTDSEINEIFVQNDDAEKVILNAVSDNENIVIISSPDCDKSLLGTYIKKFIEDKTRFYSIKENIFDFTDIFKKVISGKNGYITILDIASYSDIIDNIKMLVLLSFPNVSETKTEKIIAQVSPVIIHFSKDDDGLFCITDIGKIENAGGELILNSLYTVKTEENVLEEIPAVSQETLEIENIKENKVSVQNQDETEIEEPVKKINKYKLLREKIHNKRLSK